TGCSRAKLRPTWSFPHPLSWSFATPSPLRQWPAVGIHSAKQHAFPNRDAAVHPEHIAGARGAPRRAGAESAADDRGVTAAVRAAPIGGSGRFRRWSLGRDALTLTLRAGTLRSTTGAVWSGAAPSFDSLTS